MAAKMSDKIDKRETKLLFVNLALFALLTTLTVGAFRYHYMAFYGPAQPEKPKPAAQPVVIPPREEVADKYSIEKVKSPEGPAVKVENLQQVYEVYPKTDAGPNIVENWKKLKPEDKIKTIQSFEKVASEMKQELAANPANKKLKHELFIIESMKSLMDKDFNIEIKDIKKASAAIPGQDSTQTATAAAAAKTVLGSTNKR